jgi:hypothetical protein
LCIFRGFDAPEGSVGREPCGVRREASSAEIVLEERPVCRELAIQIGVRAARPQERSQAPNDTSHG